MSPKSCHAFPLSGHHQLGQADITAMEDGRRPARLAPSPLSTPAPSHPAPPPSPGERDAGTALRLDREALLKEMYHRVRNNLQVVQSLLSLQQRATDDPLVRSAIDKSIRRVRSMTLVHDMLTRSGSLSAISLPAYVSRLVEELQGTRKGIAFHIDIPAITVQLDQALPLGLLLTELITNSLEHAFPGQRTGDVWIRVTPLAGGYIRLHVSDNGVGFDSADSALPVPPGGMGLKLANALAGQLGGQVGKPMQGHAGEGTAFEGVLSLS